MQWLKQSTAITLKIGPFLDETDGKTAETGLTIAQADVRLSKNGGNIAQKNEATSCTHDELGIYGCPIDTTDTATLGRLQLWVHESGALPVWHEFMVVPANVWDSMFGADMLKVDVHSIDDDETAADNLESACDNYSVTRGLTGTALPAAAADAAGGLPISDAGALDLDTQIGTDIDAILADTNELQTDLADGGRLDLLVDAIKAKTDNLPADPADDSDIDAQLAAIAGYLDTEIAAILADTNELQTDWVNGGRLDLLVDAIKAVTDLLPDGGALNDLAAILADTGTDGVVLTDDAITAPKIGTAAFNDTKFATNVFKDTHFAQSACEEIADYIWDEPTSGHQTAGTTGKALTDGITAGAGAITFTYTLTSSVDSSPIASATVWVTTDQAGTNVVASGTTNTSGEVTFYLDAGTYYVWREKSGWNFTNPDTETVA
jgi:hypothetical protein